jgi:hypothetical protein
MWSDGLDVFGVDVLRLVTFVVLLAGLALALGHLYALWALHRDKRRLVDAVGPIAFVNGGLFAERGVHHRLRALFYAIIAGLAVVLL